MRGILRMTVLAAAVFGVAGNALAEDWKLAKDEDGVKVYLSSVQGSKYKAYRGVTAVSYTHLDVYKRQSRACARCP